eukprot:scaffold571864_cov36-Prasinocladus_malaysianus.AAC.2
MTQINLDGILMVDPLSQQGLGIFSEEQHPSAMGIGKPKEGFSLFGLLDRCRTQMGRRLLRLWLMRPLVDADTINSRLNTIELLLQANDQVDAMSDALTKVLIKKFCMA